MIQGIEVGDVITLAHGPFIGVFYKVVGTDSKGGILLDAYSDRECTRRRPLADGRLVPPKEADERLGPGKFTRGY